MIYPPGFDLNKAHIIDSGRVFQVLRADGSYDDAATGSLYYGWTRGSAAVVESPDTVAGRGLIATVGYAALIEAADRAAGTGKVAVLGGLGL